MSEEIWDDVSHAAESVAPAVVGGQPSDAEPYELPDSAVVSDAGDSILWYATTRTLLGHELPSEFELGLAGHDDHMQINQSRIEVRQCRCILQHRNKGVQQSMGAGR